MITSKIYSSTIPSDIQYVSKAVTDIISSIEKACGRLDECIAFEFKVVLNELLINAIKHGNCEDAGKCVKITVCITKDNYACLVVEDEGEGYDLNHLMEANKNFVYTDDICCFKETGRGMLIVENLCDKLKLNKKGNKVLVVKKLYND